MTDRLVVDVDGLATLAGRLDRIVSSLNSTGSDIDAYSTAIGDGQVLQALRDFDGHWHDGRKHLTDNAQALSGMLGDAVGTLRHTDDQLADSITSAMQGGSG